jgi:copper resistance protein B
MAGKYRNIAAAALALMAAPAAAQRLDYADVSETPPDEPSKTPWLQYGLLDRFEWGVGPGRDSYAWDFSALIGGEVNRVYLASTGEGVSSGRLDYLELNALYSRNVGGGWDLNAGLRYDAKPHPNRVYAVLGAQFAPGDDDRFWLGSWAYLSDKGELSARIAAYYNQPITDWLFLQPSIELDAYAQDVPPLGLGRGLGYAEAGLRLRAKLAEHAWPYVGLSWSRDLGRTARLTRAAGDDPEATSLVIGIRSDF